MWICINTDTETSTHRKHNCGRHQEARGKPIPDRHSRKEELSNLSPIHGSTYSKIPFWHGSRNPWHKIATYLRERYTNKDNTKERSAWARLCSTSEWICSLKNLFALDLVFISDQIIEFGGNIPLPARNGKEPRGEGFQLISKQTWYCQPPLPRSLDLPVHHRSALWTVNEKLWLALALMRVNLTEPATSKCIISLLLLNTAKA